MRDKPLFCLQFALKFLVGRPQLLVFDLDFVEKLLDPHKMVHIVFELSLLQLRESFLHNCELSFEFPISSFQVPKMLVALAL